jgi:hypothetical protein
MSSFIRIFRCNHQNCLNTLKHWSLMIQTLRMSSVYYSVGHFFIFRISKFLAFLVIIGYRNTEKYTSIWLSPRHATRTSNLTNFILMKKESRNIVIFKFCFNLRWWNMGLPFNYIQNLALTGQASLRIKCILAKVWRSCSQQGQIDRKIWEHRKGTRKPYKSIPIE